MLLLKSSKRDINRKLWNIQVMNIGRKINTKSKPFIAPIARLCKTKSLPNITDDDDNWWSHAKLAITNVMMRGYSNQMYWDKVVPIKLNVVHPRPVPEVKSPPEQYSVACHVPYDHGNKYSLHKIDPSYNIGTDSVRPIHLKVIVPGSNDLTSQQRLLKEPNIMTSYPSALRRDYRHLPKNV